MNTDQKFLQMAERRLKAIRMDSPESPEIKRFEFIVSEIRGRMSEEDLKGYEEAIAFVAPTEKEKKAARKAELESMEANVDKPSI